MRVRSWISSTASARSISAQLRATPMRSTSSSESRSPAVSITCTGTPSIWIVAPTLSRVVPAIGVTIASSAPAVVAGNEGLRLSALSGEGIAELRKHLLALAGWHAQPEGVFIARTRHVQALRATREHLSNASDQAERADAALDLLAEELRLAHDALGEITGAFSSDQLLGEIFSRFCIGK